MIDLDNRTNNIFRLQNEIKVQEVNLMHEIDKPIDKIDWNQVMKLKQTMSELKICLAKFANRLNKIQKV